MYCPNCGKECIGKKFCENCGENIEDAVLSIEYHEDVNDISQENPPFEAEEKLKSQEISLKERRVTTVSPSALKARNIVASPLTLVLLAISLIYGIVLFFDNLLSFIFVGPGSSYTNLPISEHLIFVLVQIFLETATFAILPIGIILSFIFAKNKKKEIISVLGINIVKASVIITFIANTISLLYSSTVIIKELFISYGSLYFNSVSSLFPFLFEYAYSTCLVIVMLGFLSYIANSTNNENSSDIFIILAVVFSFISVLISSYDFISALLDSKNVMISRLFVYIPHVLTLSIMPLFYILCGIFALVFRSAMKKASDNN